MNCSHDSTSWFTVSSLTGQSPHSRVSPCSSSHILLKFVGGAICARTSSSYCPLLEVFLKFVRWCYVRTSSSQCPLLSLKFVRWCYVGTSASQYPLLSLAPSSSLLGGSMCAARHLPTGTRGPVLSTRQRQWKVHMCRFQKRPAPSRLHLHPPLRSSPASLMLSEELHGRRFS